jgi:hypothetical protein
MNTHNHANHTARSTGLPPMEVLTAAEADAIVGGGFFDDVWDVAKKAYNYGKKAYEVGKGVYDGAKKVVKFFKDLF